MGELLQAGFLCLLALSEGHNPLTPREREVLVATLLGISHTKTTARLSLSEGAVCNHLSAAIQKLRAHNRMEAALGRSTCGQRIILEEVVIEVRVRNIHL